MWHTFWAWHPVKLHSGEWVWLEIIQRMHIGNYTFYRDFG